MKANVRVLAQLVKVIWIFWNNPDIVNSVWPI